jgi:hypothetical protein
MKLIAAVLAACALAGCASQTLTRVPTQTYQVGQRIQATPGGVIISSQAGELRTVKRWVGVLNSSDGWETVPVHNPSFVRTELIYSGISGSTIEIGYREYRGGLAAPAFYQSAKYDLAASREISFQNFRLRIDSADNNGMTGVLLSDGVSSAAAPTAAPGTSSVSQGRYAGQAEALGRRDICASQANATLAASGPGFETYSVPCRNGDSLMVRCEITGCRALR